MVAIPFRPATGRAVREGFPFWPGLAGRFDCFMNFCTRPFDIGEGAALFGVRASGQQVMRQLGRSAGQNIADDEHLQFAQQIFPIPVW